MATASMATMHEEPPPKVAPKSRSNKIVATLKMSAPNSLSDDNSKVTAPTSKELKTVVDETTMEHAPIPSPNGKSIMSTSFPLLVGNITPSPDGKLIMSTTTPLFDGIDTPSPVGNSVPTVTHSTVSNSNVPISIPLVESNVWATNNMNKFSPTIESTNVFFKFRPSQHQSGINNVKGMIQHSLQEIYANEFMSSQKDKIAPIRLVVNKGSVITYYYDDDIGLKTARATTRILKSAIESAYKGTREHRLVGVQDTNISYKAINGKEVAIWFDKILSKEAIKEVNIMIFNALSLSTEVCSTYGFPKPVKRITWVYRLQKIVGFTRTNMTAAFVREGLNPTYFRLMFGALDTNALSNEIGEYARVILSLEEGAPHLTSIMVETNRGTFPLALKVREDICDVFKNKFYPPQEEHSYEPSNNPKHKTALCFKFRDNGICPRDEKCGFAHGVNELRELQDNPKVGLTENESMRSKVNFETFPVLTTSSRPTKVYPPLVVDTLPGIQLGDDVSAEFVVSVVQSVAEKDASVVQSSSSSDSDDKVSETECDLSEEYRDLSESTPMISDGLNDVLMGPILGVNNAETQAGDVDNGIYELSKKNKNKMRQSESKMLKSTVSPVSKLRTVSTPLSPNSQKKLRGFHPYHL